MPPRIASVYICVLYCPTIRITECMFFFHRFHSLVFLPGYQVKLANSTFGTVMVNYMGNWGYVCPDNFTDDDATVVCKEKGFLGGNAFTIYRSSDHRLRWLNSIRCKGSEQRLSRCPGAVFGTIARCSVSGDAAVVCYKNKSKFL